MLALDDHVLSPSDWFCKLRLGAVAAHGEFDPRAHDTYVLELAVTHCLQPVGLQPVGLQPLGLQPVDLQPVDLQPGPATGGSPNDPGDASRGRATSA